MSRQVYRNGKWEEGKAAPEELREDLRQLPGDLVTKDIDDDKRVHEIDDPHIVADLTEDYFEAQDDKEESAMDILAQYPHAKPGERVPLNQWEIDLVRLRVMQQIIDTEILQPEPRLHIRHLWFPENNVNHYELRDGNPPNNKNRPKHLKNFRIEVDLMKWPPRIVEVLKRHGVELPDLSEGLV